MTQGLISAGWISAGIGLVTLIFTMGGAWALIRYEIKRLREDQEKMQKKFDVDQQIFRSAIDSLKDTIREEFDRAINRINKLLFEDGGTSRYLPRSECDRNHGACRNDLMRRIERLEEKSP